MIGRLVDLRPRMYAMRRRRTPLPKGRTVKVVKRINNNAVMCTDSKGRSVVAFGKGIAFAVDKETGDLPLAAIERTFYNVDEHYLALLEELSPRVLAVSAEIIQAADLELPYELSHNAVLALADHITFALQRAKRGITVQMPLAYDVAQMYPIEYKVGVFALRRIFDGLNVELAESEGVGIAMCLLNARLAPENEAETDAEARDDERLIGAIIARIEKTYGIEVDRHGFEFARFATHIHYLFGRIRTGEPMNTDGAELYGTVRGEMGRSAEVLDYACVLIEEHFGCQISDSEKLYVLMHIHRISHPRV